MPVKYVPARGFLEDRISNVRRKLAKRKSVPESDSEDETPNSSSGMRNN